MSTIENIIKTLRLATKDFTKPAAFQINERYGRDPFLILISCILSLRTKDTVSLPASIRLFQEVRTPQGVFSLGAQKISLLIYPVGFYKQKSLQIIEVCKTLIREHKGLVPSDRTTLLQLKGVGPKTAALVLGEGFGIPAICVDVHVHRISNRLGIIATQTPQETEKALEEIIPQKYWIEYNRLLVMWGQNICVPISPKCSLCPLRNRCFKKDVIKFR